MITNSEISIKSQNKNDKIIWDLKYEAVVKYGVEYGTCNVNQNYKCSIDNTNKLVALGKWLSAQRSEKKRGSLLPEREEKLQLLADKGLFDWDHNDKDNKRWLLKFESLLKYVNDNGHCCIPKKLDIILPDNSKFNLSQWLGNEMHLQRNNKLKQDRIQLFQKHLIDPGYLIWDKKQSSDEFQWNSKYNALLNYMKDNGHCNIPDKASYFDKTTNTTIKLGAWLTYQRREKRKNTLKQDRLGKLQLLVDQGKLLWDFIDVRNHNNNWEMKYDELLKYYLEYQTCNVTDSYKCLLPNGSIIKLGRWLGKQRYLKKINKLKPERLSRLQQLVDEGKLNWELSNSLTMSQSWDEKYNVLLAYGENRNTCEISKNVIVISETTPYTTDNNAEPVKPIMKEIKLGYWLLLQKTAKRDKKLKPERELKLQKLVDEGKLSWDLPFSSTNSFNYYDVASSLSKPSNNSYSDVDNISYDDKIDINDDNKEVKSFKVMYRENDHDNDNDNDHDYSDMYSDNDSNSDDEYEINHEINHMIHDNIDHTLDHPSDLPDEVVPVHVVYGNVSTVPLYNPNNYELSSYTINSNDKSDNSAIDPVFEQNMTYDINQLVQYQDILENNSNNINDNNIDSSISEDFSHINKKQKKNEELI